ncbi:type I toxin-antitoxin system SymE family toxin [Limnobaculum parvum]|uniref:Type I toxin-antitoxin system SymE family toxin n=1 Tax=Limnobaculum parvum TaxID=2172103 RepID=A0A2Y9TYL4_9GAMM|nr:SymE family type I addiction module toxin [Limnobaculum parvum]AWH88630.1 type I toxin-antitoxin system SymE family toxin [Limnobaculum parvum]
MYRKKGRGQEPVTSTTQFKEPQKRYYTVGYTPNLGKKAPCPKLTISGYWLEQFGFTTGQPVTVTTERGRLVIETEIKF